MTQTKASFCYLAILVFLAALMGVLLPMNAYATTNQYTASNVAQQEATSTVDAAMSKFGLDSSRVIEASSPAAIETALQTAGGKATASAPWAVHVPAGSYAMPKKLEVPANVVLVAEGGAVFTPATASNFTQFFTVSGSVYGGTYNGQNKAYYCLRFADVAFSGKANGTICNATTSNAQKYGIVAIGANTKNAVVEKCTAKNCGTSGISAVQGAHVAKVSGCSVSGCKQSGVNLGHANIDVIANNKLTNNKGHGISTDIAGNMGHKYCYMKTVTGNTITGNGVNGVYIDQNCRISKSFANNKVTGNKLNGLSISAKAYVKGIANNTISSNKSANLSVAGSGAVAYIGNKNTFSKSGTNNVTVDKKGKVILSGSNNTFTKAHNIGISIKGKGSFTVKSGSKNTVSYNRGFGICVNGKSTCTIMNMKFKGNKGFAVKVYKGCKIKQSKCGLSTKATAKNRLYIG